MHDDLPFKDALAEVFDRIVEVRQFGHNFPHLLYLASSKEIPSGYYSRGKQKYDQDQTHTSIITNQSINSPRSFETKVPPRTRSREKARDAEI
jgi:hypothetical protein